MVPRLYPVLSLPVLTLNEVRFSNGLRKLSDLDVAGLLYVEAVPVEGLRKALPLL